MRDHGACFSEEDRARATHQLEVWDVDRARVNVVGCFYAKQSGSVPAFCNFQG
jgi:hypothetical protein